MQGTSIERKFQVDFKKHLSLILLAGMFALGMIYGVLLIQTNSGTLLETIKLITQEYTVKLQHQTILQCFSSSFVSTLLFILLPYLLGYSAIAQPLILLTPLFKGLGLGFFMANLYLSHGLKGMAFCALLILPDALISIFCIVVASREALRLSNMFFQCFSSKRQVVIGLAVMKLYHIKLFVLLLIGGVGSLINVVCVLLFSRMFNF